MSENGNIFEVWVEQPVLRVLCETEDFAVARQIFDFYDQRRKEFGIVEMYICNVAQEYIAGGF